MKILQPLILLLICSNLFAICPNFVGKYDLCQEVDQEGRRQNIELNYLIQQKSLSDSSTLTMTYIGEKEQTETIKLYENMSSKLEANVFGTIISYEANLQCTHDNLIIRFQNGKLQDSQLDSEGGDLLLNLREVLLPFYQKSVFTYSLNENKDLVIESELAPSDFGEPIKKIICKRI